MKLKSQYDHRASLGQWCKSRAKSVLNNGFYPFVESVRSEIPVCFVVGCGHSGTTLVASRIGGFRGAYLVGTETDIFNPEHGLYSAHLRLEDMLRLADAKGASCLVEKTPKHVHAFDRISRIAPTAKYIVVTRNPIDTCASLYSRFGSIEYAIERYKMDNRSAERLLKTTNTAQRVSYEALTASPESTLDSLAEFLGLTRDGTDSEERSVAYEQCHQSGNMRLRSEQVAQPITNRTGEGAAILSRTQKNKIKRTLGSIGVGLEYTDWLEW